MQRYPPETKAAVLAALATGESVRCAARRFGISRNTVTAWRAELAGSLVAEPQKKEALGEQVYGYLEESITTLGAQARFVRDPAWLKQQSAADIAMLHGVMFDKTARLLGALQLESER